MRKLIWLGGVAALVAAIAYTAISLGRWEWNRALFFGLTTVMAEVALATALILSKLTKLQETSGPRAQIEARVKESRPSPNRFEWLEPLATRNNVFITLLIGGGVLISGLAWLIDKVAARTTTLAGERKLVDELERITYPHDGLVVDDVAVLAQDLPFCDDPQLRMLLRRPSSR